MAYPEHIQYIIDNYSNQLLTRLREEGRWIPVEDALDILLACDSTDGKKLVDWLVKTYLEKGFLWEDVEIGAESKLAEVLGLYQTCFVQIPRNQRNIYDYGNYGELYKLVKPYLIKDTSEDSLGSREIRRRERARALEESEVLYRSENMIVAVPLTENAAVWWGRGTKWCTAADKNNYFNIYNENAPLIVITLLNKDSALMNQSSGSSRGGVEKFQLWMNGDNIQFMDSSDTHVDRKTVEKHWMYLEPILEKMIDQNSIALRYVPIQRITQELLKKAVKQNGQSLYYAPAELLTAELCMQAVKQTGKAIRFVQEIFITPEILKIALLNDGNALQYLSTDMKTAELCGIAVKQAGQALFHVPKGYRTLELCTWAVEQNVLSLIYMPNEIITNELCWWAVGKDADALDCVPDRFLSPDLCRLAVQQKAITIRFVPREMKTFELCAQAIEQDARALAYIPKELKTVELCWQAVEKDGVSLAYVPNNFLTAELCNAAVKQNGLALEDVPEDLKTVELCRLAVEQTTHAIKFVPEPFKINEFADVIITKLVKWDKNDLNDLKKPLQNLNLESPLDEEQFTVI